MEIILEILSAIFGAFLETFFELLAQAVFELAAEYGLRSLAEPFRRTKPVNPFLAGTGYLLFGAIAGGLSLMLPRMFVVPLWLRLLNLVVTPIACGFIMVKVGQIRERRGEKGIGIDRFLNGYMFALAMAIVRFAFR